MTKQEIIDYLMTTPHNTNKNVLETVLAGIQNKDEVIKYALYTPRNMNRMVLESLIIDVDSGSIPTVGTAVVGRAII